MPNGDSRLSLLESTPFARAEKMGLALKNFSNFQLDRGYSRGLSQKV